jgi:hypothetical protein
MGRLARRQARMTARSVDPEGGNGAGTERSINGLRRESDHLRGGFVNITSLCAMMLLGHAAMLGWEHVLERHILGAAFQATSCLTFVLSAALVRGVDACFTPGVGLAVAHFAVWCFVSTQGWSDKHPTDHMFPLCSLFFAFIVAVLNTMDNKPAEALAAHMYDE